MIIPTRIKQKIAFGLFCILGFMVVMLGIDPELPVFRAVAPVLVLFLADDMIGERGLSVRFRMVDYALLAICLYELTTLTITEYQKTPIETVYRVGAATLSYFFWRFYLSRGYTAGIVKCMTLLGIGAAMTYLPGFFRFYGEMREAGFEISGIAPLRYLLIPAGIRSNTWGVLLLLFVPFGICGFYSLKSYWMKTAAGVSVTLLLGSAVLTFSRGTLIVLTLFLLLMLSATVYTRAFLWKRVTISVGAVFLILGVLLFPFRGGLESLAQTEAHSSQMRSVEGRFDRWDACLELMGEHPWIGIGGGNYPYYSMVKSNADGSTYTSVVNNLAIQLPLEKGIPGTAVYLFFFFAVVRSAWLAIRRNRLPDPRKSFTLALFLSVWLALLCREMTFSVLLADSGFLYLFFILTFFLNTLSDETAKASFRLP